MAIDLPALKSELDADPLTLGYSGMDSATAAAKLNEVPTSAEAGRKRARTEIATWELFAQTDIGELQALGPIRREVYLGIMSMGVVNIADPDFQAKIGTLFAGSAGATVAALTAYLEFPINRADFLGFGKVKVGWVEQARALP